MSPRATDDSEANETASNRRSWSVSRTGPWCAMERCNGCGACCRVLTLSVSPEEIAATAAIARVLGIPSDHVFASEHWRPLGREEAMQRNPYYTSRLPADAYLYTCDRLGDDGRCLAYDERPLVCRGYPWYDEKPRHMPLADPGCGYAADLVDGGDPGAGSPPLPGE